MKTDLYHGPNLQLLAADCWNGWLTWDGGGQAEGLSACSQAARTRALLKSGYWWFLGVLAVITATCEPLKQILASKLALNIPFVLLSVAGPLEGAITTSLLWTEQVRLTQERVTQEQITQVGPK